MTPSGLLNAGLSCAIVSSVPPRRTPSSVSTTVPSSSFTAVICAANLPSSMAAAAFSCEARENSSSWVREKPHRSAIISAPIPWFGGTPRKTVASRHPDHRLHAARDHDLVLAADQASGGEVHRLLRRAALPVHGHAGHAERPARSEHRVAGDVERLLAELADAAPDHVVHDGRVDARAPRERP